MSVATDQQAVAAALERAAGEVACRRHRLALASATPEWEGAAARAFRQRAEEASAVLGTAAHHLDTAAEALRRHALTVARRMQELEDEARNVAGHALTGVAGLL